MKQCNTLMMQMHNIDRTQENDHVWSCQYHAKQPDNDVFLHLKEKEKTMKKAVSMMNKRIVHRLIGEVNENKRRGN